MHLSAEPRPSGSCLGGAAEHARRLELRHGDAIGAVVPVASLLAETALIGQLREDDARAVAQLSGVVYWNLMRSSTAKSLR